MELLAVSFGSRGDVEPFVALGRSVAESGHRFRLLTHPEYRPLAEAAGVELIGARGRSTRDLIESEEGRAALRETRNPLRLLRRIADLIAPELALVYEDVQRAAQGADALLAFPATFPALDVAEHLRRPIVHVHHVPAVPTRRFPVPAPYIPARTLTPVGNRMSYTFDALVLWRLTREAVARTRAEVLGPGAAGAPRARAALRRRARRAGAVVGVSPHVVPPPPDWPADVVATGFWWAPPATAAPAPLDAETEAFLAAGPPPVFLGFGSTPLADPEAVTRDVLGAATDAGVRLVLQRGWAGVGAGVAPGDGDVHVVGDVAYDALFPRVAAVAHHGGAGTTALGLRHGRPTLALPAVADQFFWGHRIAAIGAGPAPLPARRLRRAALATRLRALVGDERHAARAGALSRALAGEDGGAVAAAAIERFLGGARA